MPHCAKHGYTGLVAAFRSMLAEHGVTAFYRGITPTLLGILPYAGISFATFETLKFAVLDAAHGEDPHALTRLACGGAAGLAGQVLTYPLDIVRRRMQTEGYSPIHAHSRGGGSGGGGSLGTTPSAPPPPLTTVFASSATAGGGRGNVIASGGGSDRATSAVGSHTAPPSTTSAQSSPWSSGQALPHQPPIPTTSSSTATFSASVPLGSKAPVTPSFSGGVVAGGAGSSVHHATGGGLAAADTAIAGTGVGGASSSSGGRFPVTPHSMRATLSRIVAEEGVRGLFKGLSMNFIKGPVSVGVSFTTYDLLKFWWGLPP